MGAVSRRGGYGRACSSRRPRKDEKLAKINNLYSVKRTFSPKTISFCVVLA